MMPGLHECACARASALRLSCLDVEDLGVAGDFLLERHFGMFLVGIGRLPLELGALLGVRLLESRAPLDALDQLRAGGSKARERAGLSAR